MWQKCKINVECELDDNDEDEALLLLLLHRRMRGGCGSQWVHNLNIIISGRTCGIWRFYSTTMKGRGEVLHILQGVHSGIRQIH